MCSMDNLVNESSLTSHCNALYCAGSGMGFVVLLTELLFHVNSSMLVIFLDRIVLTRNLSINSRGIGDGSVEFVVFLGDSTSSL